MSQPIATLEASPPRRVLATGMLLTLGAMMLWFGLAEPGIGALWRLGLVTFGVAAGAAAMRFWRSTSVPLILRDDGLYDANGRLLCRIDDIIGVERGVFAFKPANGFLLRLDAPARRAWAPGMWWRFGRRLGIGGVTGAAQARYMAELIALHLVGEPWPPRRPDAWENPSFPRPS